MTLDCIVGLKNRHRPGKGAPEGDRSSSGCRCPEDALFRELELPRVPTYFRLDPAHDGRIDNLNSDRLYDWEASE